MTDRCPLCGEPLFQGKCTKCGYMPPVKEELDAEAGIYDFDPSSYPSDDDEIRNALPPLERDIKYDEPSALHADSIMAEPLGGEYAAPKKISLKKPAKAAPTAFADPASKPNIPVNLKKYEDPDEAALIRYIAAQKSFDNDTLSKLTMLQDIRNGREKRSFKVDRPVEKVLLCPDVDNNEEILLCLMTSLFIPLSGIIIGTQILRSAKKAWHYIAGIACLILGLMIFIFPGLYEIMFSGEID